MRREEEYAALDSQITRLTRERDEARAEIEQMKRDDSAEADGVAFMREEARELRAEVDRLRNALDKIARLEPGLITGGLAAWTAAETAITAADNCNCAVSSGPHAETCPRRGKVAGVRDRSIYFGSQVLAPDGSLKPRHE